MVSNLTTNEIFCWWSLFNETKVLTGDIEMRLIFYRIDRVVVLRSSSCTSNVTLHFISRGQCIFITELLYHMLVSR